jgi:hypothetical protein
VRRSKIDGANEVPEWLNVCRRSKIRIFNSQRMMRLFMNKSLPRFFSAVTVVYCRHAISTSKGYLPERDGRVWNRDGSVVLQQYMCAITHAGAMDQRAVVATMQAFDQVFVEWSWLGSWLKWI